ncbi:MAG: redox-regulated ATPase YchF [Candidatus Abyssubacteria bacterium]
MKIAIIGLAQSGKTTLFGSLVGSDVAAKEAHGHGVHVGNVKVPDVRLDRLAQVFKPPKVVYADVDVMDIIGGKGEPKGTGLTPETIAEVRGADALMCVVRAFENPAVVHPLETIDPLRDMKNIDAELSVADMIQVEKRLQRIEKEHSEGAEKEALLRAKECLDSEKPLRLLELSDIEARALAGFSFLTLKPSFIVVNVGEGDIGRSIDARLALYARDNAYDLMAYCAEIELEISELDPAEQTDFLREMGLEGSGRERLLRKVYEMLNLISFFTIADTEIRAWSVPRGIHAVEAAGKVHSDMQRGFIRAEVINFEEFVEVGSMQTARDTGRLRLEGKDYEVKDGDIIRFRFHV